MRVGLTLAIPADIVDHFTKQYVAQSLSKFDNILPTSFVNDMNFEIIFTESANIFSIGENFCWISIIRHKTM